MHQSSACVVNGMFAAYVKSKAPKSRGREVEQIHRVAQTTLTSTMTTEVVTFTVFVVSFFPLDASCLAARHTTHGSAI
jgi:hypothetical protein